MLNKEKINLVDLKLTNLSLDLTPRKDRSDCFLVFHYCGAPTADNINAYYMEMKNGY